MKVFRISTLKYSDDMTGEGSRLFGGRWNHKGIPCIYTSENRALALLEYTVNINVYEIPRALCLVTYEIPDDVKSFTEADLPGNWKEYPAPYETKNFGTEILKSASQPVIRIPSTIITQENNFMLNPLHKNNKLFKVTEVKDFVYDVRIKIM